MTVITMQFKFRHRRNISFWTIFLFSFKLNKNTIGITFQRPHLHIKQKHIFLNLLVFHVYNLIVNTLWFESLGSSTTTLYVIITWYTISLFSSKHHFHAMMYCLINNSNLITLMLLIYTFLCICQYKSEKYIFFQMHLLYLWFETLTYQLRKVYLNLY